MNLRKFGARAEKHFLEYSSDISDERLLETIELEEKLHEGPEGHSSPEGTGLKAWSAKHEKKYDDFSVLNFNPKKYRFQRIDEHYTPPSALIYWLPSKFLFSRMRQQFIDTIGPRAEAALDAYENTPANEGEPIEEGGKSVFEELGNLILKKEAILIAVAHAESLDDVALNQGPVALAAASRKGRFIDRVGTVLSKTLSREQYKGRPVVHLFKFFGKIFWTIPESKNTKLYDLSEEAVAFVKGGGMRALERDIENNGTTIVMAPGGSAMELKVEDGQEMLEAPDIPEQTLKLLDKFRHYAVAASWGGKISVSSIYELPDYKRLAKEAGKNKLNKYERQELTAPHLNRIATELAQRTANAAGLPVRYTHIEISERELSRKVLIAYPENP